MSDLVDIYEPVITDLKTRIADLQATLENLERLRGNVSVGTKLGLQTSGTGILFSDDAFFGMTAGDAAKKFLSATKKTATVSVIGEALIAGGWKTSSKNLSENLRSILSRHPDFVRINGAFGLAEWYPGRKTAKRPGSGDVTISPGAEGSFAQAQRRELANHQSAPTEPWPPVEQ